MLIARTKSNPEEFDCFDTNKRRADGIGLLSLCTTGLFVGTLVAR
jgi:hypothetical protein